MANSCDPEVAAQLKSQLEETETAWNNTRKNLQETANKYKKAVKLWKSYRQARDDIKKWIEEQTETLNLLQNNPENATSQIKVRLIIIFFDV